VLLEIGQPRLGIKALQAAEVKLLDLMAGSVTHSKLLELKARYAVFFGECLLRDIPNSSFFIYEEELCLSLDCNAQNHVDTLVITGRFIRSKGIFSLSALAYHMLVESKRGIYEDLTSKYKLLSEYEEGVLVETGESEDSEDESVES